MVGYMQVLVATAVSFIVGALWYSPLLFGNTWMKLHKFKKKDLKSTPGHMILGLVVTLLIVGVQGVLFHILSVDSIAPALFLSFLLWVGFVAAPFFNGVIWEKMPVQLFWLKSMHYLTIMLISGLIFIV